MKTCPGCQQDLPETAFYMRSDYYGRHALCKTCYRMKYKPITPRDPTLMPLVFAMLRKYGPMTSTTIAQMVRAKRRSKMPTAQMLFAEWQKWPNAHLIARERVRVGVAFVYRIAGDDRPLFFPSARLRARLHIEQPRRRDVLITDDDKTWMAEQRARAETREVARKLLRG